MKLTVIGFYGGAIKANSAASSYLIETDEGKLLVDCGPGSTSKLQEKVDLNTIHHLIISHYHYDHFSDVGAIIYHRLINLGIKNIDLPLNIYAQDDHLISRTIDMGLATNINFIDENTTLDLLGINIDFLLTKHPVKCLAMRFIYKDKKIVYTADSAINMDIIDFAKDADLLLLETSLYEGFDGKLSGHMNTEDAANLINDSECKQAILTHLPIYGDHRCILNSVTNRVNVPIQLASEFLEVEL